MKECIAEYDCFISIEHTKNLQIVNHCEINNYNDCNILSASYKHKIPELEMIVEFPKLTQYCKPGFENTNTKINTRIDEIASKDNNFVIYFNGNEAHFVPILRPILKSFVCNVNDTEYKKTVKKQTNSISENRNILDEFRSSCSGGVFEILSPSDRIRQVFVPAEYESYNGECSESKRNILLCYGRRMLKNIETTDTILLKKIALAKNKKQSQALVAFTKTEKSLSLETEILNILLKHKMVKFNNLMDLLRSSQDVICDEICEQKVLGYLPTVALMIRGYWVIKSEVLYIMSKGMYNFPAEVMSPVRDYVMCLFHDGIETTAKKIQSITKIPSMEATEILEQFANRVTDPNTGKCQWKFKEGNYEFILKHHDINTEQNQIMAKKKDEVCRAFKLQTLLGDACSSKPKRQRSISSQIEYSDSHYNASKRIARLDFSPPILGRKRLRLNSTPMENSEIEYSQYEPRNDLFSSAKYPNNPEHECLDLIPAFRHSIATEKSMPVEEEIIAMMENLKNEPVLSPAASNTEGGYPDEDIDMLIKAETGHIGLAAADCQHELPMIPNCFPTAGIYEDIKNFMNEQFNDHLIIPVNDLATIYLQDHLPRLHVNHYEIWRVLNNKEITIELERCICAIMDEKNATKIDIEWPQIAGSLSRQILYLSVNKSIEDDRKFVEKLLEMLKTNGSVTMGDLKKALSSDNELKRIMSYTSNILRDKIQRYCLYRHRKFYLKYTVS